MGLSLPGWPLPSPWAGSPLPPGPLQAGRAQLWTLLLTGIRRASSKFLLTLAAPVSLPAAGSVLGGRKWQCYSYHGPQDCHRPWAPTLRTCP